ncbi:hypothetical protein [Hyphomicrobium sp.]|uniref:hypothetical protein n=1 Tax=Hyphomicrobium sp. TaxID=82 RepID=UPI001D22C1BE|nr:hypothetical protein [Hyphomicrobium sp.]MBY0559836.1 hypothetical protein [Hyphomicrobium sp.]
MSLDEIIAPFIGKGITDAELVDDEIRLTFLTGETLELRDAGPAESVGRYITANDDMKDLNGYNLAAITLTRGDDTPGPGEAHEICFLEIRTDCSFVTLVKCNGHLGGFGLAANVRH